MRIKYWLDHILRRILPIVRTVRDFPSRRSECHRSQTRLPAVESFEPRIVLTASPVLSQIADTGLLLGSLTAVNNTLFFVADSPNGVGDRELWKSDGTAAGTQLVRDISPGSATSFPTSLTRFGNQLLFGASDGNSGSEPWISDGTTDGTRLLRDINPSGSSSPSNFTVVGDLAFFTADNGVNGTELWRTNGTAAGTSLVKDIITGNASSSSDPTQLVNVNGTLFFTISPSGGESELWRSDGTPEGTLQVADINPGTASSSPDQLTNIAGQLFFTARTVANGVELWTSNPQTGATVLVQDLVPGASSSNPTNLTEFEGDILFAADGKLWRKNRNLNTATALKSLDVASNTPMVNVNGTVYFTASDGTTGFELWKTDGTAAGTALVRDLIPGDSNPTALINANGKLVFAASNQLSTRDLWTTDGTENGTVKITSVEAESRSFQASTVLLNTVAIGSQVFLEGFAKESPSQLSPRAFGLWRLDTSIPASITVGRDPTTDPYGAQDFIENGDSTPSFLNRTHFGELFLANESLSNTFRITNSGFATLNLTGGASVSISGPAAEDFTVSKQPATTLLPFASTDFEITFNPSAPGRRRAVVTIQSNDPDDPSFTFAVLGLGQSEAGAAVRIDLVPGSTGSDPRDFLIHNDTVYFTALDSSGNRQLWKTDSGASVVTPLTLGSGQDVRDGELVLLGDRVFFVATDTAHGQELWVSDGTVGGTRMFQDLNTTGGEGSNPDDLLVVNGFVYFDARSGGNSSRLWRTDGSLSGIQSVLPLDDNRAINPDGLSRLGNLVIFAGGGGFQQSMWRSDGTASGTFELSPTARHFDFENEPAGSFMSHNGILYFEGFDNAHGTELWRTDGTVAGTQIVKDIRPGSEDGFFTQQLQFIGNQFFFNADNGSDYTTWVSDGTELGTIEFPIDFIGDLVFSDLSVSETINNTLFVGTDAGLGPLGVDSFGLWRTDGTVEGTRLVYDLQFEHSQIEDADFDPLHFVNLNGRLVFSAVDPANGRELWTSDGTTTGTQLLRSLRPGELGSDPRDLINVNGNLFFTADDGGTGRELWVLTQERLASVSVNLENGVLAISDISGNPTNITVALDNATSEIVVTNLVSGITETEARFPLNSITGGIRATLSPENDRFVAAGINLPVTVEGGHGDDTLIGSMAADSINGGGGNDVITGNSGVDTLAGGEGLADLLDEAVPGSLVVTATTLRITQGNVVTTDTHSGFESGRFVGDSGANSMDATGVAFAVSLLGGSGADTLLGGAGNDVLQGGDGDDSLVGGSGNDSAVGEAGNDVVTGSAGADTVDGGAGNLDRISDFTTGTLTLGIDHLTTVMAGVTEVDGVSGVESALLFGGSQANRIDAAAVAYPVTINGGNGNDTLIGGNADDSLNGQDGNDVLVAGGGNNLLVGGNGSDTVKESGDFHYVLSTPTFLVRALVGGVVLRTNGLTSIERGDLTGGPSRNTFDAAQFAVSEGVTILGNNGNDIVLGSPGPDSVITGTGLDSIDGNGGNDSVFSGSGNDTVNGGAGNDNLNGQNGNDLINGDGGNDVLAGGAGIDTLNGGDNNDFLLGQTESGLLNGGAGNDTLQGNTANDTLNGDAGDDRLFGQSGNDLVSGGDGNDSLTGDAGLDTLNGDAGADTLAGGLGNDRIDGGADFDQVREIADSNFTVSAANVTSTVLGVDTNSTIERLSLTGGPSANFLDAALANIQVFLFGDAGNDRLQGGSRNDFLSGGTGDDTLNGGAGNDTLEGAEGNDGLSGYTGNDSLIGGLGRDTLFGHDGADTLLGGADDDSLIGGGGTSVSGDLGDSLNGEAGADVLRRDPTNADVRSLDEFDTESDTLFTTFPSWVDRL